MNNLVTLLIPTHNRHQYLQRILEYYQHCAFKVIVADSTPLTYQITGAQPLHLEYRHLPGMSLTAKLEHCLQQVLTPYVVMCADDDFILPDAIQQCIDFLQNNTKYAAAQGNSLAYHKPLPGNNKIHFSLMYRNQLDFEIADDDSFARLEKLFHPYRSIFYAVHRTANLALAFNGSSKVINNLYLNEYLTSIVPIVAGRYIELPIFYQVREYSFSSDDKTTDNLDSILTNKNYGQEFEEFMMYLVGIISPKTGLNNGEVYNRLSRILKTFAHELTIAQPVSFKKKIGNIVAKVPVAGSLLIKMNRRSETQSDLRKVIRTEADQRNLLLVEESICKHLQLFI